MKKLEDVVKELPPELQQEVYDFALSLLETKVKPRRKRKLRLNWAGALREYRDQYTSLELQQKALEWRKGLKTDTNPSHSGTQSEEES